MPLIDRIRPLLLRWERLLALAAIGLPLVVAMIAGFAWMVEHGWLMAFIVASIGLGGLVSLTRLVMSVWHRRMARAHADPPAKLHTRIDPDWSATEKRAFAAAQAFIDSRTSVPLPWEQLYPVAQEVVRRVAKASGKQGKGLLDFTLPEALLLIDRVTVRLRSDLRDNVPFADSISVGTLHWLWEHRDTARRIGKHGWAAWRVFRAVKSLPIAILREIEGAIAEGHTSFLTGEGTATVQALMLEEVAAAAVELYSGRLRFSDAELLAMRRAAGREDRARRAGPDMPLRIAVAGQVSAGKSSLINALLGSDLAETDIVAVTDRPQTYPAAFEGVASVLLDLPGLDGSKRATAAVLEELCASDMVIWTIRANRPAREIDRATIALMVRHFQDLPDRRMPPLMVAVTCIDEILDGWPFPENLLTDAAMTRVTDIVAAIAGDIGGMGTHPVPVVLTAPDWNTDTLRARVNAHVTDALMTQRNRLRVGSRKSSLRHEARRAGRGLRQGISIFGARSTSVDDGDSIQ